MGKWTAMPATSATCAAKAGLGVLCILTLWANVAWSQSLTVLQPDGVSDRIAEGRDFAAYELGNRWDMNNAIDVATDESGNVTNQILPTAQGTYKLTSTSADPGFYVNWSGIAGTNRLERGERFPIDASVYRRMALRVKHNGVAAEPLQVLYFVDMPVVAGTWGFTNFIFVPPNEWVTLLIDLDTAAQPGQTAVWPNFPEYKNLRIDPGVGVGTQFEFDWVRLYEPASPAVPSQFPVTWSSDGLGGATVAIEVVDAVGTSVEVVNGIAANANSHLVDMAAFPPGSYTFKVRTSTGLTATSPGAVTINDAPIANLTQPDIAGDEDNEFALNEVGNPWGPFDSSDVSSLGNVTDISYSGGILSGTATSGDSGIVFNTPTFIDANQYRMLSLDYELEGPRSGLGSVFRLFWGPNSSSLHNSDDYIIKNGRNRYMVGDMRDVVIQGPFTSGWWNGAVNHFRFDPHEFAEEYAERPFHLYSLKLAPLDSANPMFTFEWEASDVDDNASMDIYLDTDRIPANGNEITVATGLTENGSNSYTWDASGVAPGEYYAYIQADDGMNRTGHYATGPLLVGGSANTGLEVQEPAGGDDRVASGGDFGTDVLANPWDFSDTDDVIGMLAQNVSGFHVNENTGRLIGTAATNDPRFWVTHPDYFKAGSVSNGRILPIDPDEYRYLVTKVRVTANSDQFLQAFFLNENGRFDEGNYGFSEVAVVGSGGWQIVVIDLWDEAPSSPAHWRDFDRVRGLRIDPVSSAGVSFELDWIRLVPNSDPQVTNYTVQWDADALDNDTIDILVSDADGASMIMAEDLPATLGSTQIDLGLLAPGQWTVRAIASSGPTADSPGTIDINAPPTLTFLQPDSSGDSQRDFAALELGNPWGDFDPGDVVSAQGIGGLNYTGGQVQGTLLGPNPNVKLSVGTGIDASSYRMLSVTFSLSSPNDTGSLMQVFWNNNNAGGEELLVDQGLQTYVLGDLSNDALFSFPESWAGLVNGFRIDPHLSGLSKNFTLAEVRLQRYDTMAGRFNIQWVISDPDDNALVRIYSDRDRTPNSGNEVLLGQISESAGDELLWTADSNLAPGIYHVYAEVSDGLNTNSYYAGGPIEVLPDLLFGTGGFEN